MMRPVRRTLAIILWYCALTVLLVFPMTFPAVAGQLDGWSLQESSAPSLQAAESTEERQAGVLDYPFKLLSAISALLPTVTTAPDFALIQERLRRKGLGPPMIGEGVDISELKQEGAVQEKFFHFLVPTGGTLLGMRIHSPGAVGMRIGLLIEHIPAEVKVAFFFADATAVASQVTGEEIVRLTELNRAAGDLSDEGRTWWSPVVKGEETIMLLYLPEGVASGDLHFTIPQISHIFQEPLSEQAAASCHLDATCYPSWSAEAGGVAKMIYTKSGGSYLCTGSLLNDNDTSSYIPYFLSAYHCIATQTVASTLDTFWFYQSGSCNGSVVDSRSTSLTGGATLLYASSETDTAFMRLNNQPPSGVTYLGWTTTAPSSGDEVTGLHQPDGDWKKINFGDLDGYYACWYTEPPNFTCSSSSTGAFLLVDWTEGLTESGSSGSALFNSSGQVIGQLKGGSGSCGTSSHSYYGRFDLAFYDGLDQWLYSAPAQPDFVVTSISLSPAAPTAGGSFGATVTVKNQGAGSGNGKWLNMWPDRSGQQSCGATGGKRKWVGTLAAGESKSITFTDITAWSAGSKTFRAFVDSRCGTTESNEGNNQRTKSYVVGDAPDFVVTSISLSPAAPTAEGSFSATVTVKNQGAGSGNGKWLNMWPDRSGQQTCGATGGKRKWVGTLAAGESKSITFTDITAWSAGSKTFRAFVDSRCGTTESNEGNNQRTKSYTVD